MDLSSLYQRDLDKLTIQIQAFPDTGMLWKRLPGITNPAGNLALHLEGNLLEYVGRQLGNVPYRRDRALEFAATDLQKEDLLARLKALAQLVPSTLQAVSEEQMKALFPIEVLGGPLSVEDFLIHLYGHLNWHLGQIDYLRRVLAGEGTLLPGQA